VSKRKNLEPIIALIDEYLIIIIIVGVLLYGLYIKGVITLQGFLLLLLLITLFILIIVWRIYVVYQKDAYVGPEALIGKTGVVVEDLDPEGMVEVEGELWKAQARGQGFVPRGTRVRIIDYIGLTLIVVPAGEELEVSLRRTRGP